MTAEETNGPSLSESSQKFVGPCDHIHNRTGKRRRSRHCADCDQLINSEAKAPESCYLSHIEMAAKQGYCGDCGNKL